MSRLPREWIVLILVACGLLMSKIWDHQPSTPIQPSAPQSVVMSPDTQLELHRIDTEIAGWTSQINQGLSVASSQALKGIQQSQPIVTEASSRSNPPIPRQQMGTPSIKKAQAPRTRIETKPIAQKPFPQVIVRVHSQRAVLHFVWIFIMTV